MKRDYNEESRDSAERKYSYDFDGIVRRYMMRTFAPFFPNSGKALELGCYMGDFTALLAPLFPDLTVVEAADELIAEARTRVPPGVSFVHGTFEQQDFGPQFESVFLIHTLEHLDDPVGVLRRIAGWLTPTGRLFLAVPNANAPSRQIAVKMGLIDYNSSVTEPERKHGHRVTYSMDTMLHAVRSAGLHSERCGGVMFKPLANFQFDRLLGGDIISDGYIEGCYELGMHYPDLCSSIYSICRSRATA